MARIAEHHDLVPVPVDLVENGVSLSLKSLQKAITPTARVLVVAHLFGVRSPMEPILQVARQHGLIVVEDCAQVYWSSHDTGHPGADVAMFSFGPIKTATALGGGLLRVRDTRLTEDMRRDQSRYPVQSRWSYLGRLLKYSVLKAISVRPIFAVLAGLGAVLGLDCDRILTAAARNFPRGQLVSHSRQNRF